MTLTLPAELLAERAILACMLDDAALAKLAAGALRPEHFSDAGHREIYVLFLDLLRRSGMVDLVEADAEARRQGITQGNLQHIGDLAEADYSPARIEAYIRLITEAHERRGAQEELFKALDSLASNNGWRERLINLGKLASASSSPHAGRLQWLSAAGIREMSLEDQPWIWEGYLARQSVTLFASAPKAGKSTLAYGLIQQLLAGRPFLGRKTEPGAAIYLSEEPLAAIREKLDRFDLADDARFRAVSRRMPPRLSLPDTLREAVTMARGIDAALIVVDTLAAWADWDGEDENSAGKTESAFNHFKVTAADANAAVLVIHHTRKGDGKGAERVRGSSALAGAADLVLCLAKDAENRRRRKITAESRYAATPEELTFDLTHSGYELIEGENTKADKWAEALAALPDRPPGITRQEWALAGKLTDWTTRQAAIDLLAEKLIVQTGTGKHGDPYRYFRRSCEQPDHPQEADGPHLRISPNGATDKPCDTASSANPPAHLLPHDGKEALP